MNKILSFFDEKARFAFLSSVVMMILAHGFCFMNIMYTHDSLSFYESTGVGKVGLGRWLYPFFVEGRLVATPWLMGSLSILFVSLSVVIVTKLFDFNRIQGICVAILFTTNITLTSLFYTYIFDADADCFALLLACFAVYASKYFPKAINIVIPAMAIVLCLALYQAYICVAIGLFLLLLIYDSKEVSNWKDVLKLFLFAVKELVILILATVVYVPLMHTAAKHYGVELSNDYNGAGQLSSLTLQDVLEAFPKAYIYFRDTFFSATAYNTNTMIKINWLMIVILVISFILFALEHRKFMGGFVLVIPCVLLMPLALNAIFLVSFGTMHNLMIFAFNIAFLLPIVFIRITPEIQLKYGNLSKGLKYIKDGISALAVIAIIAIGVKNVIYDNGAYVYKKLVYDNTALHAQTIWKDIYSTEGFIDGQTQIVLMGSFDSSKAGYYSPVGERYDGCLTGTAHTAITYDGRAGAFYYGILGRSGMNLAYNDADISQNEEYLNMPAYPKNGYCKMIGDRIVIKMNE